MPKGNAIAAAVLAASSNPGSGGTGTSVAGGVSPLVASYSQQYSANVPYSPLPRPPATFLNGAFGPFNPITAMPIDPPREDTGRPDIRRFQYNVGYNLPTGVPGDDGYKLAPFATLRALADTYSVARSCVDKRKQEIIGLEWDIVPTDEAEHALMDDEEARADWEKRRAVVKEFFSHPDSDRAKYPTFGAWLSAILEDRFVIDAVAIHLVPPRRKGAGPFGSDLASLDVIDGSTCRPLLNTLGATPLPPAPAIQVYEWGVPRADALSVITDADIEDLPEAAAEYRADQMIYMRETPRANTPYGLSCIEKALLPISIGLARQQYQNLYFQDGSIPGMFVTPGPDISTPQQIRQLQDALNAMAGDVGAKHRMIVFPPGSKAEMQKPFPLADQFDEWIISQVAMPFGLTPMDLGVTPRVSAVQTPSESRELSQINSDKGSQTRIEPVCASLKATLFDYVIQQVFKQKDMQFSWGLTDRGKNRQALIDQGIALVKIGEKTLDEFRIDLGDTPYGLPETSVPLVYTATGAIPLQAVAADQAQPAGALPPGTSGSRPPAQDAAQITDDELTTPAHEAARALPRGSGAAPKPVDVQAADAQKQAAELEILARYLRKGRDLSRFRPEALPAEAIDAAAAALPQGVPAAVKAAKDAAGAKWRQDRRDKHLEAAAAAVAARLGQLVQDHKNAGLSLPHLVDGGVAVMADGYRQAMTAGTSDASDDYEDTPVADDARIEGDAQSAAEEQRGYLTGLVQDVIGGLSLAAIGARLALYAATLYRAYNASYGDTVMAAHPDYEIVWELGDSRDHCSLCVARAGKPFTVKTLPGWPGDGGFGGIDATGGAPICLGGPNCFPAGTLVQAADIELGYKRWYDGELVEIKTAGGHKLSGTPNHPVLTVSGWKPLGLLKEGDHLVCGSLMEPPAVDPHVQAVPADIEQVVDALSNVGAAVRHSVLPVDFHGDGSGSGEVEIVGADSKLLLNRDAANCKPFREFALSGAYVGEAALASLRHADAFDITPPAPPGGAVSGSDLGSALLGGAASPDLLVRLGRDLAPSLVGFGGDLPSEISAALGVDEPSRLAEAPDGDATLTHDRLYEVGGAADFLRERLGVLAVDVALDDVVLIERRSFSGHVYNLETAAGWYVANGILVHNCRCSVRFVQGGKTVSVGTNTQLSWSGEYYDRQNQAITAARAQAAQARAEFVDSLPEGPAIRAATRDELRRQVADLANRRIRAAGGYPGVSVEPQDIPAWIIARMLPPGLEGAAGVSVPQLDVARAVQEMFAAKGVTLDLTKSEFTSLMTGVFADLAKGGVDLSGAPGVDAQVVYRQLLANYRPEGIGWVRRVRWVGPVQVPRESFDTGDEASWAASEAGANRAHVRQFARRMRDGDRVDPVVAVQVAGRPKLKVVDGHHRFEADEADVLPVTAYVGFVQDDSPRADWALTHLYQVHQGGDPLNKTGVEDPSRVAFLLLRARNGNGKWRYLLQLREDGSWGLPGGKTHVGESPWAAAVRETGEELGDVPAVKPAAVWSRASGDTVVWTFLVELPEVFSPPADGETADETAGWGWFRRRDVTDLPLHPAMRETWESLDFDDERLGGDEPGAVKASAGTPGLTKRSGMISLDLEPGTIPVASGGLEDHHCTIVYLGPDVDDEAFMLSCERARAAAAAAPGPLSGVVGGLGTFTPSAGSDGLVPVFAEVELPGVHQLRSHLADLSASEHTDYHPHVTLKYVQEGEPLPEPVAPTLVTFTHLSVHRGDDEVVRYPLGGVGPDAVGDIRSSLAELRGKGLLSRDEGAAVYRAHHDGR